MASADDESRRISKLLFGSLYRLELAAAIGRAVGPVCAKDLVEETGIDKALVAQELLHFKKAGILQELPTVDGMRKKYMERRDSPYWTLAGSLLSELKAFHL